MVLYKFIMFTIFIFAVCAIIGIAVLNKLAHNKSIETTKINGWNSAVHFWHTTGEIPNINDAPIFDQRAEYRKAFMDGFEGAIEKIKERENEKKVNNC